MSAARTKSRAEFSLISGLLAISPYRRRARLLRLLASHLRAGTNYTFAPINSILLTYCGSHGHAQAAIGKGSGRVFLKDSVMPATLSPFPATGCGSPRTKLQRIALNCSRTRVRQPSETP
jgi:hypothetical protein